LDPITGAIGTTGSGREEKKHEVEAALTEAREVVLIVLY
jgi:hypothetical protein